MEAFEPPVPHDQDADVEDALRRGERRPALTMLMARYGDRVLRYAYAMVRDASLAEDVRQQVFVQAFRDFHQFAFRAPIRTWLFCIARHRSLDARRRIRVHEPTDDELPIHDEAADPCEDQHRRELAARVGECMDQLSKSSRDAVVLRYHEELSYEEAAQITGERPGTLQRRVARALPVLRRCLDGKLRGGAR